MDDTSLEKRLNPFTKKLEVNDEGEWRNLEDNELNDEDFELLKNELEQLEEKEKSKVVNINRSSKGRNNKKGKNKDVEQFFDDNGNFQPVWLAKYIRKNVHLINDGQFLYRYDNGVYKADGERYVRKLAQSLLQSKSRKSRIEETLYWLKNDSLVNKDKINRIQDEVINITNGNFFWREGDLYEHTPKFLSTIQLPVEYEPYANDPIVMDFVKSIVPDDTVDTVFEMIGYCLLPHTRYEKAFMLTGRGANGKSTLINMITALIGKQNVSNVALQELEENRFKLAELDGKLLNTFADLPQSALRKSSNFKLIVSGDRVNAERKNKDPFDFSPFAKMIFSANEIPKSSDVTEGFFRRWIIVPFPNKFEGKNRDTSLIDKLTTPKALSTLLNLSIEGLKRLEENNGFTQNESTKKMLEQYRKETDNVGAFINECCVLDNDTKYSIKDMYRAYERFCDANGYKTKNNSDFNKLLKEKCGLDHYKRVRTDRGLEYCWIGITLKDV
jgi:putative DNA primase/helicase